MPPRPLARVRSAATALVAAALGLAACTGAVSGTASADRDPGDSGASDTTASDASSADTGASDTGGASDTTGSDTGGAAPDADTSGPADAADSAAIDTAAADGSDTSAAPDSTTTDSATTDSTSGDSSAWAPAPIPSVGAEPPPACAKAKAASDYFQFLDNLCDEKVVPTYADPDLACPVVDASPVVSLKGGASVSYAPSAAPVVFGDLGLAGELPSGLQVAVVLIRRVGGVPHYRYLSNGSAEQAVQPWSTTKVLAAANAAATLRIASNYKVGLTASVGVTPLGDLVTSVVNYDSAPYSSNSLGAYLHNLGGRAKANALIHAAWLQRPATESFGGNYGEAAPSALGYTLVEPGGASLSVSPDSASGIANHLSMFTLAEAHKRLVLHREEPNQRLPGIQWADIRVLLYGAPASAKYGAWGGMSADTALYLQAGHDIGYLADRAQGRWRVFSKLGLGTKGQFVHVGYACFPLLDPQGKPVPGWGREFVIAAHLASGGASWKERDRLLAKAYRSIVSRIVDGSL